MLDALVGVAVVGAAGLWAMDALKDTAAGDALRDAAVGGAEVGLRGYALVEEQLKKVAGLASDVIDEARARATTTDGVPA